MKLFVKLMIFILVLGMAGPFLLKGPDGRPLMTIDDIMPGGQGMVSTVKGWFSDAQDAVPGMGASSGKTTVYRWRDERGQWHFADRPRVDGASQQIIIDPDANQLDSAALDALREARPTSESESGSPGFSPLTISPSQVGQLMEDARGVQDVMNKRTETLDSI